MTVSRSLLPLILIGLLPGLATAQQRQVYISAYHDSNPTELTSPSASTIGLKGKYGTSFSAQKRNWSSYGSILGQGYLEPVPVGGSKLIFDSSGGIQFSPSPQLLMTGSVETFQKFYIYTLRRSGWTDLKLDLDLSGKQWLNSSIGLRTSRNRIDYGDLTEYSDMAVTLGLNSFLTQRFFAELTLELGAVEYLDHPVRKLEDTNLVLIPDMDQRDEFKRGSFHLKYSGSFILGVSMSYERVNSNSVVSVSDIWLGKVYASGYLGDRFFLHLVLQGMDKNYTHPEIFSVSYHRDPEEGTQNQIHLQIERIMRPGLIYYVQFSHLKNETIYNRLYFTKSIFESGLKFKF